MLSFRRLILCFVFLAIFTMAVRVTVDSDTWWHLAAGRYITESGEIIHTDPFSLTRKGQSWSYPGWLAQIILYRAYELSGYQGLILLTAFCIVLAFGFIWPLMDGPLILRASILILAIAVSAIYWSARPQIMSFALTGLFFLLLVKVRAGNHRLALLLPLVMALWVNLHGGFAIGFILLVGFFAGEAMEAVSAVLQDGASIKAMWWKHRRGLLMWIGIGFVCALAVMCNPHGAQMLLYPFKTVSVGALQDYIEEWQSPNFHLLKMQPFLWMLVLLLVSLALSKKEIVWASLILSVGFTYLSLVAARNIASFALVSAPFLCKHVSGVMEPILKRRKGDKQIRESVARILNAVILILMLFAAGINAMLHLDDEFIQEELSAQTPVGAVRFIRDMELSGNLFNSYNWGGYVIWAAYPQVMSFVDGRTDLFDDEILEDYLTAWLADPEWKRVFSEWNIEIALLETDSPLSKVLALSGWKVVYSDEQAVVLSRKE